MLLERVGREQLAQQRFLLAANVKVDQRQPQLGQVPLLAQQPAVNLDLGPVQLPVVVG